MVPKFQGLVLPGSVLLGPVLLGSVLFGQGTSPAEQAKMDQQNAALKAMLQTATKFPLTAAPLPIQKPSTPDWAVGMVSWVAAGPDGTTYILQRGDKADPVIALDRNGKVLRSWGKGMYTMPHAIRVDPQGNVWTTDAAASNVYKFKNDGTLLMTIEIGGQPANCSNNFCSTTDIAFARDGHLFIADGYRNARILEYSADGKKLNEWGAAGTGPGQFRLPHSIQIDERNTIYVADRENGRVQRFDRSGKFLGEWTQYGKTFGLVLDGDALWLSTIPRGPNSAPGWMIKINRDSGQLLGYVDSQGNHGMAVMKSGELLLGPGPDQIAQRYQKK
jgi:DNA-binding beta-propeller fold protein YncE